MIKLKNARVFQSAVSGISSFIAEGNFRFNDSGLAFKALDPSQVVLADLKLPKELFEKFDVEPSLIGLNLQELNKVLKRVDNNSALEMNLLDSTLSLKIKSEFEKTFSLPLLDLNEEETNEPKISNFDAEIEINAKVFQEALKDASLFGTTVVLTVKEGTFLIETSSNNGSFNINSKEHKNLKIKSKKSVTSKFSLSFLESIVREANPDSIISLKLKSESPMKIHYEISKATFDFYLAHMIL